MLRSSCVKKRVASPRVKGELTFKVRLFSGPHGMVVWNGGYREMNTISINSRRFLGNYLDAQKRERFPEGLLYSGLLLSGTLLVIYCLAGGISTLITLVCVLILGSGLGILKYFGDYTVLSRTSPLSLAPLNMQPTPRAA
jgi:hypothetical protein